MYSHMYWFTTLFHQCIWCYNDVQHIPTMCNHIQQCETKLLHDTTMYADMQHYVTIHQHYDMMLRWCYDDVTTMLQQCSNSVHVLNTLLQHWYDNVTSVYVFVTMMLQQWITEFLMMFQCYTNVQQCWIELTWCYNNVQCYATVCTHVLLFVCYLVMLCNVHQLCASVVQQCSRIVTML